MFLRKLTGMAALVLIATLGACNLSTQLAAPNEVALNPPTLQNSATRTPISFDNAAAVNPTRTAFAAPTITVLGGDDVAAKPASQAVDVVAVPTQPPPAGVCSLKATGDYDVNIRQGSGKEFDIIGVIPSGQYRQVLGHADNGWLQISMSGGAAGWVSPKVVTFYGTCNDLPANALNAPTIPVEPTMTPTPTGMFGFTMNIPLNHLITKVNVGSIPAGTTVMVNTTQFTGSEYLYQIVTADGRYETAHDSDLAVSETGGTQLFPTPTPYVFIATPRAVFDTEIGLGLYRLQTTTQIGDIPAGTAVNVGSAMYNGKFWTYDISTKDQKYGTATEDQLAYIPNVGGGAATPTLPAQPYFQSELGMGVYRVKTLVAIGGIAGGTAVRLSSATFGDTEWTYVIVTKDERSATAKELQLAYIPNAGGGGPTPTVAVTLTPVIPVMNLPSDVSPADVVIPDGVCTVTANSSTNLVAQPGSSTVAGVLNPGPWAQVDAKNGQGWYKVTIWIDGSQGWANINTVTLHGPCASLPVE